MSLFPGVMVSVTGEDGKTRDYTAGVGDRETGKAPPKNGFVTEGAVHKHIRNIFAKLDLAPTDRADRRVTAVLRYLENTHSRG